MRSSKVAKTLLILGLLVGGAAGLALALGLRPDELPSWMITVGMYKLAFIAAGGLFVAGAMLGRFAQSRRSPPEISSEIDATRTSLGPGTWEPPDHSRQPEHKDRDRRHT